MGNIRIVLIEDHDLTRLGLKAALQRIDGVEVIDEAANGTQGLKILAATEPDVAVVDIGLPDIDGIELVRQFKQSRAEGEPLPKILMLTMHDSKESVLAAFAAGADSYCMKDASTDKLVEAIQTTYEGHSWIDPTIASIVLKQVRASSPDSSDHPKTIAIDALKPEIEKLIEESPLTEREMEILQLIVNGCSNSEIAETLFISLGTVKTHVRNILNKLCADDRTQAAVLALRSGLVS